MICHTENDIYDKINTTQISGDLISASKDMKAKFNTFDQGDASEKISQVILNYLKR